MRENPVVDKRPGGIIFLADEAARDLSIIQTRRVARDRGF